MKSKWIVSVMFVLLLSKAAFCSSDSFWTRYMEGQTSHSTNVAQEAAYGIYEGSKQVNYFIGAAIPTTSDDLNDIIKTGLHYGFEVLFSIVDNVATGFEFSGNMADGKNLEVYGYSGHIDIQQYNFMFANKIYINPHDRVRLYLPVGLGVTSTHAKLKVRGYDTETDSDSSFAWYVGQGLEVDVSESVFLGIDGRFNQSKYEGYSVQFVSIRGNLGIKF